MTRDIRTQHIEHIEKVVSALHNWQMQLHAWQPGEVSDNDFMRMFNQTGNVTGCDVLEYPDIDSLREYLTGAEVR